MRVYHGALQGLGIKPYRTLDDDLRLLTPVMSYGGSGTTTSLPPASSDNAVVSYAAVSTSGGNGQSAPTSSGQDGSYPCKADGAPDFAQMSAGQRGAYHKSRLARC